MQKYLEIEKVLKERIKKGIYPSGSLFPKQSDLAEEFKTTRMTIRKSLERLIKVGLIYSQRGSGTYVSQNAQGISRFDTEIYQYVGLTKLLGTDHNVESQIINFQIRYPIIKEIQYLNIEEHDLVYDIKRLRIVDNDPHALEYTIMPVNLIPEVDETILEKSIYNYIENNLDQKIGSAYRKISAAKPTKDDQLYLSCKHDDPVLKINQIVSLDNGKTFELSETHHRYDHETITVYLPGNDQI